ncbi:hypothetical protein ACFVXG_12535 [Kitasatospora sp. NPDC058162]|uniref:hypothetical protein n=1 Tax=Kitasatospora sp. NPDC058162 TaxID=3346362 RepID=UPI0036DA7ACF
MSAARETRSRSTIVTAATLGVLLATGVVMASPAAYAADLTAAKPRAAASSTAARTSSPAAAKTFAPPAAAPAAVKPTLSVRPPASVGSGGRPVEFTETVTNSGTSEASYTLKLDVRSGLARSKEHITLESRAADGSWQPVELAFEQGADGFHFTGEIPGVTVAAGAGRTLHLRLAARVDNDRAGQDTGITLSSAILDPATGTVLAENTGEIAVESLSVRVEGAPTSAVIGGAPAEFDVTLANSSASGYDNAAFVLQADRHSTLQVRTADGGWQDVTGTPTQGPGGKVLYRLTEDRTLAAGASVTRHVRLAFTAGAVAGKTHVTPGAVLDEGEQHPTYVGPRGFPVDLTAATPAAAAEGTTSTRTDTGRTVRAGYTVTSGSDSGSTALAAGELARTGSRGMRQAALGAAALLAVGIGAVFLARRRRA